MSSRMRQGNRDAQEGRQLRDWKREGYPLQMDSQRLHEITRYPVQPFSLSQTFLYFFLFFASKFGKRKARGDTLTTFGSYASPG